MPLGMIGKYERLDVLGHGVSGIVYLAKDTLLNRQVALKEVDVQAGDVRRFLEEAQVMDRLRHPNIVRVNNVDRIDGKVLIDMEYVRGKNLQVLLREEGPMSLPRAIAICAQVLDALDYAHSTQVVHRDIKPANILIGRDGQVKLVDFGLAEILSTNAYAGGAGTYAYMAPEDFAEDDRSDHQSDIWAVGVTLFEMVTGQRPFQVTKVKDPFAWKRTLETENPHTLSDYLPIGTPLLIDLQTAISKALDRDKRKRYQSAGEFRDALRLLPLSQPVFDTVSDRLGDSAPRLSSQPHFRERVSGSAYDWSDTDSVVSPLLDPLVDATEANLPTRSVLPVGDVGRVVADINVTPSPFNQKLDQNLGSGQGRQEIAQISVGERELDNGGQRMGRVAKLPASRLRKAVRLRVEPRRVDFGKIRQGQMSLKQISVRVDGAEGATEGQILAQPPWLVVSPTYFDHAKQKLNLTADTESVAEPGEYIDSIRISTNAGELEVPLRLVVTPAYRRFLEVAFWFIPAFTTALLPTLAILIGNMHPGGGEGVLTNLPCAVTTSGALALMLLLVGIAANIGIVERLVCGVVVALCSAVLGGSVSMMMMEAGKRSADVTAIPAINRAVMTGGFMLGLLFLQLLHFRKWQLWTTIIMLLGLLVGAIFLNIKI